MPRPDSRRYEETHAKFSDSLSQYAGDVDAHSECGFARALDIPTVHAEPGEHDHQVTLGLEVNQKQVGQLYREWYSIADVIHVGAGRAEWSAPHPPAGVTQEEARSAARA